LLKVDNLRPMRLQDIEFLALRGDQRVTVRSETGSMPQIRVTPFDRIRAGNALMYYPEANVLVGRGVDPRSKTPAFKNVLVRIETDAPATISA
jgi:anaerobic selenocysteine-containing dehydrogenase